jgi:hypothetical protein
VTIAVIGARIAMMTEATGGMTAKIGAADLGYSGDSAMGGATTKPMALLPLSGTTQADRSVAR